MADENPGAAQALNGNGKHLYMHVRVAVIWIAATPLL
jgi:hypothetical protein